MSNEELKCVWNLGSECEGSVSKEPLFDKQLEIPVCEKHLQQHREIMALHRSGRDVEEIMEMDSEERHEAFTELDEEAKENITL